MTVSIGLVVAIFGLGLTLGAWLGMWVVIRKSARPKTFLFDGKTYEVQEKADVRATWMPIFLILGILMGFALWGLRVLPETVVTYSFPWDEQIEYTISTSSPVLIQMPGGDRFYVTKYVKGDGVWYLYEYRYYSGNRWAEPLLAPLTLGMNDSYTLTYLPTIRHPLSILQNINSEVQ